MKLFKILLLATFVCSGSVSYGNPIDYQYYKKKYEHENTIILNKKIVVSYYIDKTSGELFAKSEHKIERLFLADNKDKIHLVQFPFNSYQELIIKNAKLFATDSLGELNLKENIKVKYAEAKDYFINGIFYNDLKVRQFSPKLSIKEKNVLKYSFIYKYKDLKFLNTLFIIEDNEPIENFELIIKIPQGVNIDIKQFHIPDSTLCFKEIKENNGKKLIYKLTNSNLPKRNQLSPSINYYAPHFIIQTKSYTYDGSKKNILENTEDLYKWYNGLIKQLNTDKALIQQHTNSIIANKKNNIEKIDTIFKWCQKKIQYIAFEDGIAGFKPEEAQNVLLNKYGDCKGVSNLLIEMLRCAGFNANHAWIGTRHLPYDYSLHSIVVDNHMICALRLNGQTYFLDATDDITNWDIPSSHIQGKQVLIGDGDNYKISKVPVLDHSANKTIIEFNGQIEKNKLIINGNFTSSGIPCNQFKSFFLISDNHTKLKAKSILLGRYLKNFVSTSNNKADRINFHSDHISGNIEGYLTGCFLKNGEEIYIFPSFDNKFEHVRHEKIETPIFFNNKEEYRLKAKIKLPPNSKVRLPENIECSIPDKSIIGKITYTYSNNILTIEKTIEINTLLLKIPEIKHWDKFTKNLLKASNTPIIIKL